jgi:hypothetical protein
MNDRRGFWYSLAVALSALGLFMLVAGLAEHQHVKRIAIAIALCVPAVMTFVTARRPRLH